MLAGAKFLCYRTNRHRPLAWCGGEFKIHYHNRPREFEGLHLGQPAKALDHWVVGAVNKALAERDF